MIHKHYAHLDARAAALKPHLRHIAVVEGELKDAGGEGLLAEPGHANGPVAAAAQEQAR